MARGSLTWTARSARGIAVAVALAAALPGCLVQDGEAGIAEEPLARPGPWSLPADVRREGERQHVAYDGAPPWDGGAHCGGGLLEGTREVSAFLIDRFPQIRFNGGYACRPNTADTSRTSVHGTGRALDIMLPMDGGAADNGRGDPVANWLVTNAESIGVQYIIWDHWDWNASLTGRKDTPYGGPIPHIDHIHMELSEEGARRRTSWFGDRDHDGVRNERDNCPSEPNPGQDDTDRDHRGNRCDNCPREANEHQADGDRDGVGDRCDNCARIDNAMQEDTDGDGRGNRCDNCDAVENRGQLDTDRDGRGDACDGDDDGDGVPDDTDNCRIVRNAEQADRDADGRGNACDGDDDGDGVADERDVCPRRADPDQADGDGDGDGDACDDSDGDGTFDALDVCPSIADPAQSDLDADGVGDACDDDADGDGVGGGIDTCPTTADTESGDADADGIGDACDDDDDGDGALDDVDVCALLPDPDQADADADGIGDVCDAEPDVSDLPDPGPVHDHDDAAPPAGPTGIEVSAGCAATGRSEGAATMLPIALALALAARRRRR